MVDPLPGPHPSPLPLGEGKQPLPTGTVTFLFTDIQGSTPLWEQMPGEMKISVAQHHALMRKAIEDNGGVVSQVIGDSFEAAFCTAGEALSAAVAAQRLLLGAEWGATGPLKVRMGLHTGLAELDPLGNAPYAVSHTLNRAARIMSAGHGGQILLSLALAELLRGQLPVEVTLKDMGEHHLKGLRQPERIFQVMAPDLPSEFPPLVSLTRPLHNLPLQMTSFVGREKEIAALIDLLKTHRLVTLTGSGGTGKTRLSLQVAEEVHKNYPNGAWLVELAPLVDPALVPSTVAATLGLPETPGKSIIDSLVDFLHQKYLLLILDNCEHLVEACSRLAAVILHQCPQVQILASSREALGVAGEVPYSVPSLSLPERNQITGPGELINFEAVRLFVERAALALPGFELTPDNALSLAQICRRLDGIPLAIELAAARVKMLRVSQIADRLDDRFRLLTGGSRTALPRQQTLRALIDWSWDLLTEPERDFLKQLAVFTNGWTLEAAEQVCAGEGIESDKILDLLAQLVNKSLVLVEREQGTETRYSLLETIRQYAREKLLETGNGPVSRDKHLLYFLGLADQTEIELHRRDQKRWLAQLETEHDNLRTALEWAIETRPEAAIRLCFGLAEFWDIRGYLNEGRKWVTSVLQAAEELPPTLAYIEVLYGAAMLSARQGDVEQFQAFTEKGLEISQQIEYQRGIAKGFHGLGLIQEYFLGKTEQADVFYADSLRIWREVGDKHGIGQALGPQAGGALRQQNYAEAERLFNESLSLFRQLGDHREIAGALGNLAEVALAQANHSRAEALASESLAIYRELEDKHGIATTLRTLGQTASLQPGTTSLAALFEESCRLFRELNDRGCLALTLATWGRENLAVGDIRHSQRMIWEGLALTKETGESEAVVSVLEGAAEVLFGTARWQDSARLFGAAESYRESIHVFLSLREQAAHDQAVMVLRTQLDKETFDQAWAEGKRMALEQALDYALNLELF